MSDGVEILATDRDGNTLRFPYEGTEIERNEDGYHPFTLRSTGQIFHATCVQQVPIND